MPIGLVHGTLVSWTGSARAGELSISNSDHGVSSCLFDLRTYFEREHQTVAVTSLAPGDPVEVLADHRPGSSNCYARTVHVVEARVSRLMPGMRPPLRRASSPTEVFAPRGDFIFAGIVRQQELTRITLRTRTGDVQLTLRPDTRYLGDGVRRDASEPLVNRHVFVRAGRDAGGDFEAYQVVWGEIVASH
jgi:hypothetical protein